MTVIDVVAALEEGSLPTNHQLIQFIESIRNSNTLNPNSYSDQPDQPDSNSNNPNSVTSDQLSDSTRTVAQDFHSLLGTVQKLIKERNGEEELQTFWWRSQGSYLKLKEEGKSKLKLTNKGKKEEKEKKKLQELEQKSLEKAQGGKGKGEGNGKGKGKGFKKKARDDGAQALHHLRTLARLLLIQPELRHVIADLGFLGAEIVEGTISDTVPRIQQDLGQVGTTTGNFQVQGKEKLKEANDEIMKGEPTDGNQVEGETSTSPEKGKGQGNLVASAVGDGLGKAVQSATHQIDDSKADPSAKSSTSASAAKNESLEALKSQALAKAESVSSDVQSLQTQLKQSTSPEVLKGDLSTLQNQVVENGAALAKDPKALESLLHDPSKLKTHLQNPQVMEKLREGVSRPIITANDEEREKDLTPAKLLDVAQLGAVANNGTHLLERERMKKLGKESLKGLKENSKDSFNDERKRKLISRLRKLCVDCQRNEEYSSAILWFISKIQSAANTVQSGVGNPSVNIDKSLSEASKPLIQFIENFADGRDLRSILELTKSLSIGAKDDPSIRGFWKDTETYVRKCLLEPGFAVKPQCETEGRELFNRFKGMKQTYKEDVAKLITESASFALAIKEDPILRQLTRNGKDLSKHILVSSDGKWFRNKALLRDFQLVLKTLFDRMGVLPIPRIVYKHPEFDLVVENIALQLKGLLPSMLDIKFDNDVHLDFEKMKDSTHSHHLKVKVKGMSLRVHKLAFAFTSKFAPKGLNIHDKGIADLYIGGFGLSIYIDVPKNPGLHFFEVRKVNTKLKTLSIKVRQSNHRIMHALANSLVNSFLTKLILRHFISYGVTLGLKQLDLVLMEAKLNRGQETEDLSFEEIQRRIAGLRDMLSKYREQAGTLEIDFTRDDDPENSKKWEDAHAVKFVKGQIEKTAQREIIRNEWRSNAFDLTDELSFDPPPPAAVNETEDSAEETPAEANREGKLEPTTSKTVEKADKDLTKAEKEMEREQKVRPQEMESKIGSTAVKENPRDVGKQAKQIEEKLQDQFKPDRQDSQSVKSKKSLGGGSIKKLFGKKKMDKVE